MFMNYLVLKKWRNYEWRLYPENSEVVGDIIYKGHKLGIEDKVLLEILDTKKINNNSLDILNYEESDITDILKKNWIRSEKGELSKKIFESWNSALNKLSVQNEKIKKVIVTKLFL